MKYLPVLLLIFVCDVSLAARKIPGQIIFADSAVDVTFLIPFRGPYERPDFEALQHGVRYVNSNGRKKWLSPNDALEFRVGFENDPVRMVSCPGVSTSLLGGGMVFLHLLIDGPLKMYEHLETYYCARGSGCFDRTKVDYYLLSTTR